MSADLLTDPRVEAHPFGNFFFADTKVLMMGTMPPTPDKWCMAFHYPNFYNDMWRIMGKVFFDDIDYFRVGDEKRFDAEKIKAFLQAYNIGECPSVTHVIREKGNAADEHLTVVATVDLGKVLAQLEQVKWIYTTGGKATEVLIALVNQSISDPTSPYFDPSQTPYKLPKTNQFLEVNAFGRAFGIYRLPSTSRAYPQSLEKKVAAYRAFFALAGILPALGS